jgi:putative oxidoreductase
MDRLKHRFKYLLESLDATGVWLAPLVLRLILAKEFWDAGSEKLNGNNWFIDIHGQFPFPFSLLPSDFLWNFASGLEIVGTLALILGLGTRFFALALLLLTLVAIATVPAGQGYMIGEGGWKLPLIYLAMFLPLILSGPGQLSVDHWLRQRYLKTQRRLWS